MFNVVRGIIWTKSLADSVFY